jgi:hypothetical protein
LKKTRLGPLRQGNGSTHPRQNYAQAKSTNHQSKARKLQRAPPAHMQAPPEPMQLPLDVARKPPRKQSSCFSFALTGQTGQPHRSDRCARSSSTWHSHQSDRCTLPVRPVPPGKLPELKNSSKPHGNLLNACSKPKHAQTYSPC